MHRQKGDRLWLNDNYKSYIIPFFCQHGESQEELLAEIEATERSGAKEFCVESRVYEDFCGKIKYEYTLKLEKLPEIIEAGNAGEFVRMWVNSEKCTDAVIEVITNLGYRERDDFSEFLTLPPIGIAGLVRMKFKADK